MNIKDIIRMLRPLRNRMYFNTGLFCLFACLSVAGAVTTILAYVSLWIPVPYLVLNILYIYIAFTVASIFISILAAPGIKSLIETADSLGLKERLITAWLLKNDNSEIARLQRQDTFNAVSKTDFKSIYPIRFPTKLAIVLAVLLVITSVSFLIPSHARRAAGKMEKLQQVVNEQIKNLEKVNEELKNNKELSEAELKKILDETTRLVEELKKAKTEEDALKALSRTENELKKLDKKEQLNKIGNALMMNDMTRALGEAINNDSLTDMKQALEKLMQQLEQEEISNEELAEMLEQVAEQTGNEEVSEELKQLAEKLLSDSKESQTGALNNLDEILSGMMQSQESSGLGQAMGQLSQAMQQAKSNISRISSRLPASNQNSSNSSEQSTGSGTGQQTAQESSKGGSNVPQGGQAAGSDQAAGEGLGAGKSPDGGGGGAGEGSTNEDAGYTGREKPGSGRKVGEGYEEKYEMLYDPDHLGGYTDPSYVSGHKQEGGTSNFTEVDNIPVQKGAILSYREVLPRYSKEAASYIEKTDIPAAMKEIVREYFKALE
ncbi:MAG TPA: hypothetical protein GXX14_10380 [Clostridiaceae bacterium]|nr:hypothetical protein [Clostridiaceae bacterium]